MWLIFAPFLLIFCSKDVLSEISISQSPYPAIVGQDVTMTCTTNEATSPVVFEWDVDTDSFPILFPDCAYIGAPRPYTPYGCLSQGTTHTASMIISAVTNNYNGKIWSCTTTVSGSSTSIQLVVHDVNVGGGSNGGLPGGATANIIITILLLSLSVG